MMIISILEPLPTHMVTSPPTNLYLFGNSCFELLILATESIKYPGTITSISKVHINSMYIKYTFHFSILLIRQILGAVPLPVTVSLAIKALSLGFGFNLGFLHQSSN